MASKPTDPNTTPAADDGLRGGTQGGGTPAPTVGGVPGGTNSLSPVGPVHVERPAKQSGSTRTASRGEPEELFEAAREPSHAEAKQNRRASPRRPPSGRSRKPSHAVAKQKARDAADADTTPGLPAAPSNPKQHDQTDPTGRSHSDGASVTEGSLRPDEG